MTKWKQDARPQLGGWAPGDYICRCRKCEAEYIGAKRSWFCADCAYTEALADPFNVPVSFPAGYVAPVPGYAVADWLGDEDSALIPARLVPCRSPKWRFVETPTGWKAIAKG